MCLISCLPARRADNSLWDAIEQSNSTIVLATTAKVDGKWTYQLAAFIKNGSKLSAESVQKSLKLLDRPAGKETLSKQAVILIHEATQAISAYYVSDETGWISVDNGFVELSYILNCAGP
jgi:hypothetical protein